MVSRVKCAPESLDHALLGASALALASLPIPSTVCTAEEGSDSQSRQHRSTRNTTARRCRVPFALSDNFYPSRDGAPVSCATLQQTTMITPRFSCSQTERSVIISIYCPSVRVSLSPVFTPTITALELKFSGNGSRHRTSRSTWTRRSSAFTLTPTFCDSTSHTPS